MTRLLIVNPNTTATVTETVLAEARRQVRSGTELVGVTAGFGVSIVSTPAENILAAHAALDLLATHHAGFDAAIVAMSFDTAVAEARTLLPIPVIGITEAALHTACLLGRRFGLIVLGRVSLPLYQDLLDRIGLRSRLGGIEMAEVASVEDYLGEAAMIAAIRTAAETLAAASAVDAIVVCGAAVAGIARRLQPYLPLPILDGVGPAMAQAELLAGLGVARHRVPRRLAAGEAPTGISPALARLFDLSD